MTIEHPRDHRIPALRRLWKAVFEDDDAFLDLFFSAAFAPERFLCALEGDTVTGMLCWLPCSRGEDRFAYLYAVATHPEFRGRGICRALIRQAHKDMADQGYAGVLLRPQEEGLRVMYAKMGYEEGSTLTEGICSMGNLPAPVHLISRGEYFRLRGAYLPDNSVLQGTPFPELLDSYLRFYRGPDFLMAARAEKDHLFAAELLGNAARMPGILCALSMPYARFRTPGKTVRFTMFHPLKAETAPADYFAFALD